MFISDHHLYHCVQDTTLDNPPITAPAAPPSEINITAASPVADNEDPQSISKDGSNRNSTEIVIRSRKSSKTEIEMVHIGIQEIGLGEN